MPLSARCIANAIENVVRLQPKSACISATYVPNEWDISMPSISCVQKPAPTIHQP